MNDFNDNVVRTPDMKIKILIAYFTSKPDILQGLSQKKNFNVFAFIWEISLLLQSTVRCSSGPLVPSLGMPLMHHYH